MDDKPTPPKQPPEVAERAWEKIVREYFELDDDATPAGVQRRMEIQQELRAMAFKDACNWRNWRERAQEKKNGAPERD